MKLETRLTKNLLDEIGLSGIHVNAHDEMMSDMYSNKIYIDKSYFTSQKPESDIFKRIYENQGWEIKCSMGMFAILHEIGHVLSVKMLDDLQGELKAYTKQVINLQGLNLEREAQITIYKELPLERLADKIAMVLYLLNEPVILKYDKMFKYHLTP